MIYLCQVTSYCYTFMINPGLPRKNIVMTESPKKMTKGYKYCNQCRVLMNLDENTNHCDDCNVCVIGTYLLMSRV